MDAYLIGTRTRGPFEYTEGKNSVSYQIIDSWHNTGRSHTARCGRGGGTMSVSHEVGFEVQEISRLSSYAESTLGVKGIASLKSHIEESLETSITFQDKMIETDTFDIGAPECGSQTSYLYQLIRDYNFVMKKDRFLRKPSIVTHQMREVTGHYDMRIESDPSDPACPCPLGERGDWDVLVFQFGRLSVRVDAFWKSKKTMTFGLGSHLYQAELSSGDGHPSFDIELRDMPTIFKALSGIDEDSITVTATLEKEFDISDLYLSKPIEFPILDVVVPTPSSEDQGGGTTTA